MNALKRIMLLGGLIVTCFVTHILYSKSKEIHTLLILKSKSIENPSANSLVYINGGKKDLEASLRKFQSNSCGSICKTSAKYERVRPGKSKVVKALQKEFDCLKIWNDKFVDMPGQYSSAPVEIPPNLWDDYTYQGRVMVHKRYIDDVKETTGNHHWSNQTVLDMIKQYKEKKLQGSYGDYHVGQIRTAIAEGHFPVANKHILVIGTLQPWVESILLAEGASKVTTLDYNQIDIEHPQIRTLVPYEMTHLVNSGQISFDGMVTFSSLEHSGLGRYGDELNPWGDLVAMARAWCVLTPGARALVGVPAAGKDLICMNAHRMYGPVMYSHLFANWDQVWSDVKDLSQLQTDCYSWAQPIHVLEKAN